jgi:WD40 repeat protein
MPREVDSETLCSMVRADGARERVASGRTRISLVSWEFRLAAIVLAAGAALFCSGILGTLSGSWDRVSLSGHSRLVEAVTFSPDGRTLASCGFDSTVRLWDTSCWDDERPAQPEVLTHPSVVFATAFSPDGSLLAAAADRSLTIWARDPSYHRQVEQSGETYHSVAFSPDGRTLALGAEDGTIRLWEMPAARERAILRGHTGTARGLAFSPDGKILASGGQDGRAVLWDTIGGTVRRVLIEEGTTPIRSVAFSPDGRIVGVAEPTYRAKDVQFFDVQTGAIRARLSGLPLGINALAFSPDGRTVVTAGVDRSIKLWDLNTGKELGSRMDEHWLKSVAFSPDGRWLAYAGGHEDVGILDLTGRRSNTIGIPPSIEQQHRKAT